MRIMINEIVTSKAAVSYDEGKICLEKVLNLLSSDSNVILDFKGIDFVITAFLNPVIGDLIIQKGPEVMKKITIENATEDILQKIKIVKDGALLKREDLA